MSNVSKGTRDNLAKVVSVLTSVTTMLSLSGFAALAPLAASAAVPSDYGLKEGNTISAAGSSDPDVYIVNAWGYKRLFLNPVIFSFYGHLGGFAKVKSVTPTVRDAFPTSGLFRNCETNDQKVWAVEVNGEDTGTLHWVNMSGADAVAQDANFFKKVFCINNNEANWYPKSSVNYTSLSQVPVYSRTPGASATPTPVSGPVTVSLAADNPGASSVTRSANSVAFLKLLFTGNGTITNLRVVRKGPGAAGDFSNVYLFNGAERLTSGRTPSSADGSINFSSLSIAVNGSAVISVVGDLSSATVGNVNYFAVEKAADIVLSGGQTVGGSFPLSGNNFTVTGQTGGGITIAPSGSLANPNVGQSNVELTEFKLTAATEGAKVQRIQLINGGTVKYTDITNIRLEVNGVKVAGGVMTAKGYAVFDFGSSPYFIAKGDNRVFKMFGDVQGKKSETVIFYLETTTDLLAIGDQFGFGMAVTSSAFDSTASGEAFTLTLQGGVLTISFVGPTASNVSTTTTKTNLLNFDVNSAANIEMRKHTIILCKDTSADGSFNAASDTTNGWSDLDNVGIIDRDSGVTLVGPSDGSSFTTSNSSCPGSIAGAAKTFTDTFNITAGQTLHLAVVGNIRTGNTGSGVQLTGSDALAVVIDGYGDAAGTSGDLTVMRYTNTNTAVTKTDVVPSGDITGNTMTIQSSAVTLALAAQPTGSNSFVKGTKNISAAGFNFTTTLGNPVTVNSITLSGYVDDARGASGSWNFDIGTASNTDSSLTVGGVVSAIRLVDGVTGAVIATAPTTNNLSTSTGTAQFTSLNWAIPGGSTKSLIVQVDLSTNAVSGSQDAIAFDIAATTDVTATDANSNSINAGNAATNGAASSNTVPTTYVVVKPVGTLTPALAADSATTAPVYWGQNDAAFSKFKFTSTNEGFFIERLNLYTADTSSQLTNNSDNVKVTYTNKSGSTLTATSFFNQQASVSFGFTDSDRPYVPKDGVLNITVTGNVKSGASLFRAVPASFSMDFSGGNADEFRAVGEGSGTVIDGANSAVVNVAANNMSVYRAFPQFTALTSSATTIAVGQEVYKFKIDAIGLASDGATVFFDGATAGASGSLNFAVLASGDSAASAALGFDLRRVVDGSNASVDQLVATRTLAAAPRSGACTSAYNANCAADFNQNANAGRVSSASFRFQDVAANQSINIPAGQSNTFVLRLNTATSFAKPFNSNSGRAADFLQIRLLNVAPNDTGEIAWTDNGGVDRNNSVRSKASILKNLPADGRRINFQ